MPYFRVGQRAVPVRPVFPNQQINPRLPIYQQPPPPPRPAVARNRLPQQLPVLNAPFFPKENEFYEGEEEQQQHEYEEAYAYPTMSILDQHGLITPSFSNYQSFQHYPKQQLIRPVQPYYHR